MQDWVTYLVTEKELTQRGTMQMTFIKKIMIMNNMEYDFKDYKGRNGSKKKNTLNNIIVLVAVGALILFSWRVYIVMSLLAV